MDRRKLGILFILVAAVLGVVCLFWFLQSRKSADADNEPKSVLLETPDGFGQGASDSKLEAYGGTSGGGKSAIENYWDEMGGGDPEDVINNRSEIESAEQMRQRAQANAEAQVQASQKKLEEEARARDERSARIRAESHDRVMQTTKELTQAQIDMMKEQGVIGEQGASAPSDSAAVAVVDDEAEKVIDLDRVRISRSSGVTSLDGNAGFGSLTDDDFVSDDAGYPFKCQFVRQEKIRGGERVTVRLLEDMVVDGLLVPKNTHLMASCSIGKRLNLVVSNVEISGRIYNLGYEAYDNDGTRGIYCPSIDEDLKRRSERVVSSSIRRASSRWMRLAQDAVQLGIDATSNSRGEITVSVPRGYVFYLVKSER